MKLKPPLKDRKDVHIYTFAGDGSVDPDERAQEIGKEEMEHEHTRFFHPGGCRVVPVVRVVPTSEVEVYRAAVAIVCEKLLRQDPRSDARASEVGVDVVACGRRSGPLLQTVRVLQTLWN